MENDMESNSHKIQPGTPIEKDYPAHESNPGPSREAVEEKDKNGAGKVLKWIIPLLVFVLLAVYFLFFRNISNK